VWGLANVLVTGGAGFIGSHLVRKLVQQKNNVRVLDNSWRFGKRNLEDVLDKIEFIEADVKDFEKVKEAVDGIDTVYHLTAILGTSYFYTHPCLVLDVGLIGTMNVLKAIVDSNVKRLLFTSSSEVYARPQIFPTPETHPLVVPDSKNPRFTYSSTKIVGEVLCLNYAKKYGFDTSIVRLHNPYGPMMGWDHVISEFIKRIVLNEKFTVQGDGTSTRSFCFVEDEVEGIILAATRDEGKNEIFNIGDQYAETSVNQLIKCLEEISGKKVNPVHVPQPAGGTDRRVPDISKAKKLLGYNPKVSFKEGLKITFDWYEKEINWWMKNGNPGEYPWKVKKND
jgi:nucleoside-diphosphate-sugar epimerase